jgi:radical SAM superfamily enzyme YgiQ (UPF0313 family)
VTKSWGGRIPIALVYPNRYATGMSNLGFQLVYRMLNQEPDVVCERVFLPEAWEEGHTGALPRPLSLESQQPLGRFQIVAFSVPFENDYPHVLQLLASSGIPLEASRRQPPHPLVWLGGVTASLNPEPLSTFVDLVAMGEAEDLLPDLLRVYRQCGEERLPKEACLEALSLVQGVYIPSLYEARYHSNGLLRSFRPRKGAPARVRRRIASDLSKIIPVSTILTPLTEFESLFLVEIGRGCARRCRFCAAGHLFHPTRHRRLADLLPALRQGLQRSRRIGLVSSSVGDHPDIKGICHEILTAGGQVSVASLRMDVLDDPLVEALARSGHRTLSLAPEAGSQRLRDVIHKGLSEDQILESVERAARAGIPSLRLYFMVGLPMETEDDVEQIVTLSRKILHQARVATQGRGLDRLTLSVNPFVPKPSTPFQWHPFLELAQLKSRIQWIRRSLRKERNIHVLYEPPKWARIQALLARGDRRVGRVLMLVARGRAWEEAQRELNLNPDFYLHRPRGREEIFPWDFIDHGFPKESLWRAYERALRA